MCQGGWDLYLYLYNEETKNVLTWPWGKLAKRTIWDQLLCVWLHTPAVESWIRDLSPGILAKPGLPDVLIKELSDS